MIDFQYIHNGKSVQIIHETRRADACTVCIIAHSISLESERMLLDDIGCMGERMVAAAHWGQRGVQELGSARAQFTLWLGCAFVR